jgi:hypothetical protein
LLAIFFLFVLAAMLPAQPPPSSEVTIVMRFQHRPDSSFVKQLKEGMHEIFKPAGVKINWKDAGEPPEVVTHLLVLMDFRGFCSVQRTFEVEGSEKAKEVLGTTQVEEGFVLPFSTIRCDEIAQVIRAARTADRRIDIACYYRLVSRTVAHELLHILLSTTEHDNTTLRSSRIDYRMLQTEARLSAKEIRALQPIPPEGLVVARTR